MVQSGTEHGRDEGGSRRSWPSHRVGRRDVVIGGVATVAFGVRAAYVLSAPSPVRFGGDDNAWYGAVGRSVANGHWGRLPGLFGHPVYSARFPPAYPVVLGLGQRLLFWMRPEDAHVWTSVALGTLTAALVALLAWRITERAAPRARWVASAVAGLMFAANPLVVGQSVSLMAEALSVLAVVCFLSAFDHLVSTAGRSRIWPWLAAALSVAALTRTEEFFLLAATAVLTLWFAHLGYQVRRQAYTGVLVAVAIVGLWSVAVSVDAGRPVLVSVTSGGLLLGANCRASQHGSAVGFWTAGCLAAAPKGLSRRARFAQAARTSDLWPGVVVEAEFNTAELKTAVTRIAGDPAGFLEAVPYRLLRGVGLYWDAAEARSIVFEGRDATWEAVGRDVHHFLVLPLMLVTLIALGASGTRLGRQFRHVASPRRLTPYLVLVLVWLVIIAATYGSTRFRAPIEPVLALSAGLAVATLFGAMSRGTAVSESPN